jgi:hypothetical protein
MTPDNLFLISASGGDGSVIVWQLATMSLTVNSQFSFGAAFQTIALIPAAGFSTGSYQGI